MIPQDRLERVVVCECETCDRNPIRIIARPTRSGALERRGWSVGTVHRGALRYRTDRVGD